MIKKIIIVMLLMMIWGIHSIDVILENGTLKHYYTPAFNGNKFPIINGQIITYIGLLGTTSKELQACDKAPPTAFLNQSIAVLAPYGGCSTERHVEVAQEAGALAVIVIADQTWKNCNTTDIYNHKNNIPAVCISGEDFQDLIKIVVANGSKNPPQATIAIFNADKSEYETKLNHRLMNFGTITFFIVYIICGVLSAIRFIHFHFVEGWKISIPKILLGLNILSCIFSAIIVIDMQGYRGWYNTQQFQITYYFWIGAPQLYQFIIFQAYIANILVQNSLHRKTFNILNISIFALLMTLFVTSNIVFSVYGYTWNFTAAVGNAITIIIAIIEGICGLFFLFSAIILVSRLINFDSMQSGNRNETKKKYRFLSIMLFWAFLSVTLGFAITVAITSKKIQNSIETFMAVYFVFNIDVLSWILVILLVFNPRESQKTSASSFNLKKSGDTDTKTEMNTNKSYVEMTEKIN